ncbi:MADS-box protein SOC1-like [Rhodamnia argentea]|uniref:MADS-box protein SOC1-like n=1 Tax=Rhodamnia argentea TaxID=178133 RepID=A0A8B8PDJ8_9MYRT|nr:MADS-box protein SOC1-like [Rhodamnia argentea]XP_030532885.1 MADS-box protein SOC1-like [Rhodamnia argentea]XP_048127254.1 MADS-box protein SOC1-like [Rhodamnia argentea]
MARGKIQMKRIENTTSRQATFSKRRNGLMKKAYELSVLCDAEIAVIIFSQRGRLYEFSSSTNMQKTIERYRQHATEDVAKKANMEQYMLHLQHEAVDMARQIELLELSKRKFLGQGLGSCSVDDLQEISGELERSLSTIRAKKDQLFKEQIERLKAKEVLLSEENSRLHEKCGETEKPRQSPLLAQPKEAGICSLSSQSSDVETELFIGLPQMHF